MRQCVRARGRELINRALSVRSLKSNSLSRWPVSAKTPHYHLLEELCCELSNRQEDLATEDLAAPLISLKHKCAPSTAEKPITALVFVCLQSSLTALGLICLLGECWGSHLSGWFNVNFDKKHILMYIQMGRNKLRGGEVRKRVCSKA